MKSIQDKVKELRIISCFIIAILITSSFAFAYNLSNKENQEDEKTDKETSSFFIDRNTLCSWHRVRQFVGSWVLPKG